MRIRFAFCLCISATSCFFINDNHSTRPSTFNRPPEEQGNGVEGDIIVPPSDDGPPTVSRGKRQTVTDVKKLWPNGIVVYTFDKRWPNSKHASIAKSSIIKAMKHWEDTTCLKFLKRTSNTAQEVGHKSYITFFFGANCASQIGRSLNPQNIIVGGGCTNAPISIAHELAHAAGFYHEHTRPDRDNFIDVFFANVANDSLQYFEKRPVNEDRTDEPYDIESVMHYGPLFFSKNSNEFKYTLKPKDKNLISAMGQREYLSFIDVKTMNDIYKCSRNCSTISQCQNGGYIGPSCKCNCPYGLAGRDCTDVSQSSPGCGGVLRYSSGRFTSPNFPGEYPPSTTCTWLIEGPVGSSITLTFSEFDLEWSAFCGQDHVEIKMYGPTVAGPRYCRESPGTLNYQGNALYVKFKSDEIENFYGFNATYTIH